MYKVMHPQPPPEHDDISFWNLKVYPGLGLGIAANDEGEGFIPFPKDENPVGVKVIRRHYLWFWSRSRYYNLDNPITDALDILGPLDVFSDEEIKIIAACVNYADNDPPDLKEDQIKLLVANLYTLLALALNQLPDKRITDIAEVFRCVTGGTR